MTDPHSQPYEVVYSGGGSHTPFTGGPSDWNPGNVESEDPHDKPFSNPGIDHAPDVAPIPENIIGGPLIRSSEDGDGDGDAGDGDGDVGDDDGDDHECPECDCGPSVSARAYVVPGPFSRSKQG